ncbi:TolC family protein [Polyangium sorediatum]|uniref:TolC family protein n=1 Tax=Polyangium sorediatum TaxID=889274 RepID=A0ABT6P7N6_9BACT|nr:TolC family protein [Polyangium sorediatum]MDI1436631.1 TolC family protein [Polyangium sorediatum]
MLRPRRVRALLATSLLSFGLLVSTPLAAQQPEPRPQGESPADAPAQPAPPPATPPAIDVADPALAPVPPAPKTLGNWRDAMTLIETRAPDLRIAEAEVARAEALAEQARGRYLPRIDGQGQAQTIILPRPQGDLNTPFAATLSASIGATATVPLIQPRLWYAAGTAKVNIEAAKQTESDRRRTLLANLASVIVQVVAAENQSEINRAALKTALERLELTRRRARLGTGTQLDVVRAEQDLMLVRNQLLQSNEQIRRTRESLGLALGDNVPYGVPPNISLNDIEQSVRGTCHAGKPEERPDVVAAKKQLEVAERQVGEARRGYLPTLDASTTINVTSQPQFIGGNYIWTARALLTIPIFDASRSGEVSAARASVELQKARLEAAERQARLDAQQTYRGVEVADQTRALAERTRDLAKETARLSQVAFEAGTATSFELIDAAQRLRQAELDLAQREFELVRAKIAALLAAAVCDG